MDEHRLTADGKINITGATCRDAGGLLPPPSANTKNICLFHYPAWIKKLGDWKYDLMLAGHSHGGQIRVPFYGASFCRPVFDEYDLGLFQTTSGPLYVNPGIGWFYLNARFNCRPEITVIEI